MFPSSETGARSSPVAGLRTVKPGSDGPRSGGQGIGVGRGDALLAFAAGAHPHLKFRHSTYPLTLVPAPSCRLGRSRKPGHSHLPQAARLAQSVEHETLNLRVVGSSPTLGDWVDLFSRLNFHTFLISETKFPTVARLEKFWIPKLPSTELCNPGDPLQFTGSVVLLLAPRSYHRPLAATHLFWPY